MIEKGKISSFQMGIIMYVTVLATAILVLPSAAGKSAKQDLWLSPIWASLIGFLSSWIFIKLNKLYPRENIIQYSEHIIGKFAGKALGCIYLFLILFENGLVIRDYAEFIIISFLPKTPLYVMFSSIVLVSALTVYGGIEVLARATQIFFPIFTLPFLLLIVLLLPDMEFHNILPIMGNGVLPSIRGAIDVQSWLGDFFYISFLLPFLQDRENRSKWGMFSVTAIVLTMVITNLIAIFVFGGITQNYIYPLLNLVKYISIASFFEHIEALIMALWVIGIFVKVSVIYYALALGTAQWINVYDYKPFVLPLGFLQVLFGFWVASNFQELASFLSKSSIFFFFSMQIVLPLFLLLIAFMKRKLGDKDLTHSNIR
ncbi:endospore germination permease [Bacillus sp. FJAT-53711]|uniref:Endospore germination permease n=1 Tax=Bacillus yunxiaonensis TaxID=3127665 RepID=A0ABU8G1J7_9BACI